MQRCPAVQIALQFSMPGPIRLPKPPISQTMVDVGDPKSLRAWAKCLDCSEARLRRAVKEAGPNSLAVRRWLASTPRRAGED